MRANRKRSLWSFLPVILWFAGMCVLFFMPGKDVPSVGWLSKIHFDKVVHFGLFFIFILLFAGALHHIGYTGGAHNRLILTVIVFAIAFGLAVEFIQRDYVSGRSFDIWDWIADSLGVIAFLFLLRSRLWHSLMRKIGLGDRG